MTSAVTAPTSRRRVLHQALLRASTRLTHMSIIKRVNDASAHCPRAQPPTSCVHAEGPAREHVRSRTEPQAAQRATLTRRRRAYIRLRRAKATTAAAAAGRRRRAREQSPTLVPQTCGAPIPSTATRRAAGSSNAVPTRASQTRTGCTPPTPSTPSPSPSSARPRPSAWRRSAHITSRLSHVTPIPHNGVVERIRVARFSGGVDAAQLIRPAENGGRGPCAVRIHYPTANNL